MIGEDPRHGIRTHTSVLIYMMNGKVLTKVTQRVETMIEMETTATIIQVGATVNV